MEGSPIKISCSKFVIGFNKNKVVLWWLRNWSVLMAHILLRTYEQQIHTNLFLWYLPTPVLALFLSLEKLPKYQFHLTDVCLFPERCDSLGEQFQPWIWSRYVIQTVCNHLYHYMASQSTRLQSATKEPTSLYRAFTATTDISHLWSNGRKTFPQTRELKDANGVVGVEEKGWGHCEVELHVRQTFSEGVAKKFLKWLETENKFCRQEVENRGWVCWTDSKQHSPQPCPRGSAVPELCPPSLPSLL
jgi:hypothetical protein